jgi:hypothetical protein
MHIMMFLKMISEELSKIKYKHLLHYIDSLASYAHDDIDYYRRSRRSYNDYDDDDFGGYEKPISRNDRLRMSRLVARTYHPPFFFS